MAGKDSDRLSSLPDPVRCIILSFLPFKEAARTCILSKSWLKTWESTRNIEFNELFFVKNGGSDDEDKETQRRVFLNFVEQWVGRYEERAVDKFSLKVSVPENCRDTVERCVAFATQRGVRELGLDFSDPGWKEDNFKNRVALFELPKHVYGHGSIESVKLYSCSFLMPHLLNFRALKDVSLGWLEVSNSTLRTLLSHCKAIENLSLKKCWNLEHFDMGEEKLGLTRLVIDKCNFGLDCFRFKAPKLAFFKYSGVVGVSDIDVNREVMQEAELDFGLESEFIENGDLLYRLVEDLYPVRVLTVCSYVLQVIPSGEEPVRIQGDLNVRHLIMKIQLHEYESCGITFLLHSCPMLEKLTFDIGFGRIFEDYSPPYRVDFRRMWEPINIIVPKCLKRTLKAVEVKGFRGTMNEVMVLQYFVRAGRVLKKMNINLLKEEDDDGTKLDHRRKLANFLFTLPKASRRLEISIA